MTNTEQAYKSPFNEEFCIRLEFQICYELQASDDPALKGWWCDGVLWVVPEKQLTKKYINDHRKVETRAWIGKTGQTEFDAIIHFGQKALSRYAKGKSLIECIPEVDPQNEWIKIDIYKNEIQLMLA